nr:hypothetical protein [Tanacetum cinerariifolium]
MADNRTMAQMLQAPIEGNEDAIVVPPINANIFELKQTLINLAPIEGNEDAIVVPPINANIFELKQTLINLVQSNQFTKRQDPHNHLRFFNKVTSTFRHPEVPNTTKASQKSDIQEAVTDVRAKANATLSSSSHSNSFGLQQIAAALEDKLDIRMNRFEKSLNEM